MSVSVYIDGRPAKCREDYHEVIGQLGIVPDESRHRFELWTTQPRGRVTSRSVWLNPPSDSARVEWLADGGTTLQSSHTHGGARGCAKGPSAEQFFAGAAIQIEKLGDLLASKYDVRILCGYSLNSVRGGMDDHILHRICAEHSAVYSR